MVDSGGSDSAEAVDRDDRVSVGAVFRWAVGPGRAVIAAVLGGAGFVGAHQHISTSDSAGDIKRVAIDTGRSLVLFGLWWALIALVGALALGSAWYFISWLCPLVPDVPRWTLRAIVSVLSPTAAVVAGLGLIAVVGVGGQEDAGLPPALTADVRPITGVGLLCALPGFLAFGVVRYLALDEDVWVRPPGDQLALLQRLRATARKLLTLFGAFLTLLVVATGIRRRALVDWADDIDVPVEQVLMYGLLFALILGFLYGTAASALDSRATSLMEVFAGLPAPDDAAFLDVQERRSALAPLMGVAGSWGSFESAVLVAAPLLTALIGIATDS